MRNSVLIIMSCLLSLITEGQHLNIMISSSNSPEEPSIYINPKNTNEIIAGSNINNLFYSYDGGYTWTIKTLVSSSYGVWGDPVTIIDTAENFYFFHLSNPPSGSWIDRIVCQKSIDGGISWNDGSYMGLNGTKAQDKEWAVVDRTNNTIYVTWTQFDDYGSSDPNDKSIIRFSKSIDEGETWTSALKINEIDGDCIDSDNTVEGAVPAVGPNGEIYVAWAGPAGLVFDRSLDQGETWLEEDIYITDIPGGWDYNIPGIYRCNGLPVTVCDLSDGPFRGNIYINWTDQRNGSDDTDVWMVKSTDGGITWSDLKRVNDDLPDNQQFFTWMTVDQVTGHLWFIWYDRRNYIDNNTDVYMALSIDGGESFINYKISESPFLPTSNVFFGDYNNINAYNDVVRPIWTRLDQNQLSVWTAIVDPTIFKSQWTGAKSADWFDRDNWTIGIPDKYVNAEIPTVGNNSYPIIAGNANCKDLQILNSASLIIAPEGNLSVHGSLTNKGQFNIESSEKVTGSLIDNGSIIGNGIFTTGISFNQNQWHYISTPISNAISGLFNNMYLKDFDENSGEWNYIVPLDVPLIPMKGYAVWASGPSSAYANITFDGLLNTGSFNYDTLTNTINYSTAGYNFVGNPYPSSIDWDAAEGWNKTNLDNAIYIWNPGYGNYGSYVDGHGSNGVSELIPPGQGFFVHVTTGNTIGSLSVNNLVRVHSSELLLKNEVLSKTPFLKIRTYSSMNEFKDETIVSFNDKSTDSFDHLIDAYKLKGLEEAPELYTLIENQVKLSINSLPAQIDESIIPLYFHAGVDGVYSLEVLKIKNFTNSSLIFLEDLQDNVWVNLSDQQTYNFNALTTDNPARFNLHFKFGPSSIEEIPVNDEVHIYSFDNTLVLESLKDVSLAGLLNVFQIDGRLYQSTKLAVNSKYEIEINHPGMYIVEFINDEQKSYRRKLYIH